MAGHLGGRTVEEWKEVMSHAEFEDWKCFYDREPWGVIIDDRRHHLICSLLQNIINMWAKRPSSIKVEQVQVAKTGALFKELSTLLNSDLERPWLQENQDQKDLALEGQDIFKELERKHGRKK